jgi:hypothetical protein
LQQKIAATRARLAEFDARKAQVDQIVVGYQLAQFEALGEALETCLALRLEYLRLRARRSGSKADREAEQRAQADFDASRLPAADDGDALAGFDEETREELKKRYRSAAMRCHPDRVGDTDKAAAQAIFLRVQQAYRSGDLPALRALCRQIDEGLSSVCASMPASGASALRRVLSELQDQAADLILAIQMVQLDPLYRKACRPDDWPAEFTAMRTSLDAECEHLRWQIRIYGGA